MKLPILLLSLAVSLSRAVHAADEDTPYSVAQAVNFVSKPEEGFDNMGPFELQEEYRLMGLLYQHNYEYRVEDGATWKACMLDSKQNMYARLCAAYFLLDGDEEARQFVKAQVASKNLRHRFNAAGILNSYAGGIPAKEWAVKLLIELISDGSLDGSGIKSSPSGDYPDGDRDDIMFTPLSSICGNLGNMKRNDAVPALISVLERQPGIWGAATALGEIGDKRAIPNLLKVLKDRSGDQGSEVWALGKLKATEAVPILTSRLGRPKTPGEIEHILDALLEIGDKRAIPPIEEYLKGDFPNETKEVARRVLAQLNSQDPVADLLGLFQAETHEMERSDLIKALVNYKDQRVVKELAGIARTSDSAFMRREAIDGLSKIRDRSSLLVLASLLDLQFSKDLKAEHGWKGIPDFSVYFPETIVGSLKFCTKQDFGKDRGKWEDWITKNVQQEQDSGGQSPTKSPPK